MGKRIVLVFALVLSLLAVMTAAAYRSITGLIANGERASRSYEVLGHLAALVANLGEAEGGARGFVITGAPSYLEPHDAAVARINHNLRQLRTLTETDPPQRRRFDRLSPMVSNRLGVLADTVRLRKAQGFEAAREQVATNRGKNLMDAVRAAVTEMSDSERDVRAAATATADASARATVRLLLAGGLVAFASLALATVLLARDESERSRAERIVAETNRKLVRSVAAAERRADQFTQLNKMSEMLESSISVQEGFEVVARALPRLFPSSSGALFAFTAVRNLVEANAAWGAPRRTDLVFAREQCWALRLGRAHVVPDGSGEPVCRHIQPSPATRYICVPLLAQGESLGLLHVARDESGPDGEVGPEASMDEIDGLATTVAEQVALALANLTLRETLRHQSLHDPLTGLFNRRHLEESLEREIRRAAQERGDVALVLLDLDHFKRFNDAWGHPAGDALLHAVGDFLRAEARGEDYACRFGGEEFALILPGTSLEGARRLADRLRQGVKRLEVAHEGRALGGITFSAGVASMRENGRSATALVRAADQALYRAKAEGRDRIALAVADRSAEGAAATASAEAVAAGPIGLVR